MSFAPDRRALVRAGLWTVPAVTLATTAPAFASSGPANLSTSTPGTATRNDGAGWAEVLLSAPLLSNTGRTGVSELLLTVTFSARVFDFQNVVAAPEGGSFSPASLPGFDTVADPDLGTVGYTHPVPSTYFGGGLVPGGSDRLGFDLTFIVDVDATQTLGFSLTISSSEGGVPFVHTGSLAPN